MKKLNIVLLLFTLGGITGCTTKKSASEYYGIFEELPITSIEPEGWLKDYLVGQRYGLTGYLDSAAGFPFDTKAWGVPEIKNNIASVYWYPYEQVGYWLDGMVRCGTLIDDPFLIQKAREQLDYLMSHPDSEGYLGPKSIQNFRWPHTIVFRAVAALYEETKNKNFLTAMENHYLGDNFSYIGSHRDYLNIETIIWLYSKTGNEELLDLALRIYEDYIKEPVKGDPSIADFLNEQPSGYAGTTFHGVSYNEAAKLGALLYSFTGNLEYLSHSVKAYDKLDVFHQLPSGIHVCAEHIRPTDVQDGYEICNISDYSWSLGYLLMATGDADYADQIEKTMLNTAPSVVTPDFKATQFFSGPNLLFANYKSNHIMAHRPGGSRMCFAPNPEITVPCCAGNVNRAMPNYVARMWMRHPETGGVVAALYGPSKVRLTTSNGVNIQIEEITDYPFTGEVKFIIKSEEQITFPFIFRIPGWCKHYSVHFNNHEIPSREISDGYFLIENTINDGDVIQIQFDQDIKLRNWEEGVSVERGPLIYALKIEEDRTVADSLYIIAKNWIDYEKVESPYKYKDFTAFNINPKSNWKYALCLDSTRIADDINIKFRDIKRNPWDLENAPVELRIPAKEICGWETIKTNSLVYQKHGNNQTVVIHDNFELTPGIPERTFIRKHLLPTIDTVTFVPLGCTRIRLTVLPLVSNKN